MAQQPNEEKRIYEIKIRCGESLYLLLSRSADRNNKTLADYVHSLLLQLMFGLAVTLTRKSDKHNQFDRDSEGLDE